MKLIKILFFTACFITSVTKATHRQFPPKTLEVCRKIEASFSKAQEFKMNNSELLETHDGKAVEFAIEFTKEVSLLQREFLQTGGTEEELISFFKDKFEFEIPELALAALRADKASFDIAMLREEVRIWTYISDRERTNSDTEVRIVYK